MLMGIFGQASCLDALRILIQVAPVESHLKLYAVIHNYVICQTCYEVSIQLQNVSNVYSFLICNTTRNIHLVQQVRLRIYFALVL